MITVSGDFPNLNNKYLEKGEFILYTQKKNSQSPDFTSFSASKFKPYLLVDQIIWKLIHLIF